MLVYGKYECFVMQMLYVCVLCAPCGSSQCCILHDLQFVDAGRGCNRRPYRRGIFQSRCHNCFISRHECLFTPSCNVGGTRGSGIVSSAADVLWISVVRGMRTVGGVWEMYMCLDRCGVGGEAVSG